MSAKDKDFMDRVKNNQAKKAASEPRVLFQATVQVIQNPDGSQGFNVTPDPTTPQMMAAVLKAFAKGIDIVAEMRVASMEPSRIVPAHPGMIPKLNG